MTMGSLTNRRVYAHTTHVRMRLGLHATRTTRTLRIKTVFTYVTSGLFWTGAYFNVHPHLVPKFPLRPALAEINVLIDFFYRAEYTALSTHEPPPTHHTDA